MRIKSCVSKWVAGFALVLALSPVGRDVRGEGDGSTKPPTHHDHKAEFLKLCDLACDELNKEITPFEEKHRTVVEAQTHHVPFFEDSYTVRALVVAYDITGKKEYLDACRHWADRVVALQEKMTPAGAYYLNYGGAARQPGATSGDWWVADSGSVAMGILAMAVRATDKAEKDRYLHSVKSFARLVIDKFVSKDGGITDGLWSHYDGPWWCSSATFSAALYRLYDETGDPQYLKVATGATDWLLTHDFRKTEPPAWDAMGGAPGVVFYCGESYATALKCLGPADPRRKAVAGQVALMSQWMNDNQQGRGAKSTWDYCKESTYMAGLPYLMHVFARELPENAGLDQAADEELHYVHGLLFENGDPPLSLVETWELMSWAMMSYAEKLSPGSLFRSSTR
jgi:hypothetical protein